MLIDNLPHKQTIIGKQNADLLINFKTTILEKRREKFIHGMQLLHDNAPVCKSAIASVALRELGFQELIHPPFDTDLAPSYFYLL
jgi:hypothetical protein